MISNKLITTSLLIFSWLTFSGFDHVSKIENYQVIFKNITDEKGKNYIAIRSYDLDGKPYFLTVDPDNLDTQTKLSFDLSFKAKAPQKKSKYSSMLKRYNQPPYLTAGYGMVKVKNKKGVFLTIDMCPSKKPFEKEFFENLIALAKINHRPVKVGIAISGLWILHHDDEFKWILEHQDQLDITWINHSFTHPYDANLPLENNFLLTSGVDVAEEILETEKLLIENGQVPSVYFRFPGLVSDQKLVNLLNQFGLIPLGSNAWLAKGEKPRNGSIILVHGNSNEPAGIVMMNKILETKHFALLPLNN